MLRSWLVLMLIALPGCKKDSEPTEGPDPSEPPASAAAVDEPARASNSPEAAPSDPERSPEPGAATAAPGDDEPSPEGSRGGGQVDPRATSSDPSPNEPTADTRADDAPPSAAAGGDGPTADAQPEDEDAPRPQAAGDSGDGEPTSSPTPRTETTVRFVYFKGPPGSEATGGVSEAVVRVTPNRSGRPSIGVLEEYLGGVKDQLRASAWIAAFNATAALGKSLGEYEVLVKLRGHVDGPSAGMLLSATIIALINGDELRADSTMTGCVNPDGSAGPVGGIPQKLEGAKAAGLKRFGYPIGNRTARDERTGQTVDIIDHAAALGLEAVEIRDVADAYTFMTGKTLPSTEPASELDMELDRDLHGKLRARVLAWESRLTTQANLLQARVTGVPEALRERAGQLFQEAKQQLEAALRYKQSDQHAAAYGNLVKAAVTLSVAQHELSFIQAALRGNPAMLSEIQALRAVGGRLAALRQELKVRARATTIGGQVDAVRGFVAYVSAESYQRLGERHFKAAERLLAKIRAGELQVTSQNLPAVMEELTGSIRYFSMVEAHLDMVRDDLSLSSEAGNTPAGRPEDLVLLARAYGSAGAAVLGYFDALVTARLAARSNILAEAARRILRRQEVSYTIATEASVAAESVREVLGDADAMVPVVQLAAGSTTYVLAASLVNKYYSLRADLHEDGTIQLSNRKALGYQLDLAQRQARTAATRAKEALGFIPAPARIDYQYARALREGDDSDKLDALRILWRSTFWSRLALALSRS